MSMVLRAVAETAAECDTSPTQVLLPIARLSRKQRGIIMNWTRCDEETRVSLVLEVRVSSWQKFVWIE